MCSNTVESSDSPVPPQSLGAPGGRFGGFRPPGRLAPLTKDIRCAQLVLRCCSCGSRPFLGLVFRRSLTSSVPSSRALSRLNSGLGISFPGRAATHVRRHGRPDRQTTQDPPIAGQGRVEVRLPPNSSNDSYRNDGGPDRYSGYTYRGAADVQDRRIDGRANIHLPSRLYT